MFVACYRLLARARSGRGLVDMDVGFPNMGIPKSHHRVLSLAVHVKVGDSPEKIGGAGK